MNCNRIFSIVLRQFYLMRGNFPRFLTLFVWVVVDIVLWGFMTRYLNGVTGSTYNFIPAILGAVLLWDFLIRVMQGLSMAFMEDSWSRNLLNVFASPISVSEYVSGLVLSSISTSLIGLVIMIVLATAIFGLSLFSYGLMVFPFLFILFLTGIALGIVATAIMLRFGPASEWLIWPIPAALSPFVGVFYPLSTLPHWMQLVAHILPPSYVFEGIRAIAAGHAVSPAPLIYGLGLAAVYTLLACLFFAYTYRETARTGQLARYSAEIS
jgi:ABC-2 type transport system permease protein